MGIKTGLIFVIPKVNNGGWTKEGGILRLRGMVEADVGFGLVVAAVVPLVFK